jgi:adenine-specific DNA-methyltransferase
VAFKGRLELTWTNKDQRLLSHGTDTYEWVDARDWRVSEVRTLRQVATVGDSNTGNLLIEGDSAHALEALLRVPALAKKYRGKFKLCYIDPPFNTGHAFKDYSDSVEHSVWLTLLRDRLVQIRELLRDDGSVWLHLDNVQAHRARAVMDEIFGADNFVGTVIWEKTDSPRNDAGGFSVSNDYIHVFRKSPSFSLGQVPATKDHTNRIDETGRPYYLKSLRAMGGQGSTQEARPTLYYPMTAPDGTDVYPTLPSGKGGAWRWNPEKVVADADRIEWVRGRRGWGPYYRVYPAPSQTLPPNTVWTFDEVGSTRNSASESKSFTGGTAFATPKPERLLARIITLASDPGDLVLDCFAGSATTAAVAHKLQRRWVTSELRTETIETFAMPRLTQVVSGVDQGGISTQTGQELVGDLPEDFDPRLAKAAAKVLVALQKHGAFDGLPTISAAELKKVATAINAAAETKAVTTVTWSGGGGFDHVRVGPSMFEQDGDDLYIADWATGGALSEAVAAQLSFTYDPDGPFVGRKGRARLAVLVGMLTSGIANFLVSQLAAGETLLVAAETLEPGVDEHLRAARPGSRARKIPRDLAKPADLHGARITLQEKPVTADPDKDLGEPLEIGDTVAIAPTTKNDRSL